ncbi:MAG: hypothetical protein H8E44_18025 [Planctomycetes bacterium]|nr:hypothetical protein [Planctomycetota bacterium]
MYALRYWTTRPPIGNAMIFRLSQKLAKKLKAGNAKTLPLDDNPYADWSSHLFTADRTQYIIVTNTQALYSVVMFGKGITGDSRFIERVLSTIREFMEDDGQAFVYQRFIAPASGSIQFSKPLNRSVIGSMNDMIQQAEYYLTAGDLSPYDLGFMLNDTPMSAISYQNPRKALKALADQKDS